MRRIDTQALGAVARSLGVGNPITAVQDVVFDDGNLQQSLDVSKLTTYAAGPRAGDGDGWIQTFVTNLWNGGVGYFSTQHTPASLLDELDADLVARSTMWIYAVGMQLGASADLGDFARAMLSVTLPEGARMGPGVATVTQIPFAYFHNNQPWPTAALAEFVRPYADGANGGYRMPIAVPPGAFITMNMELDGAAGTITSGVGYLVRVLPVGVPPSAF